MAQNKKKDMSYDNYYAFNSCWSLSKREARQERGTSNPIRASFLLLYRVFPERVRFDSLPFSPCIGVRQPRRVRARRREWNETFFARTCASRKIPFAERTVRAKGVRGAKRDPFQIGARRSGSDLIHSRCSPSTAARQSPKRAAARFASARVLASVPTSTSREPGERC